MEEQKTINKMGVMPMQRLILNMGVPIMISMLVQAAYNIVDSIFVSNMAQNGEEALNALTLAFPIQIMMIAIGIGTGVGTNAMLSKSLGQGDKEKVGKIAGNAMFLGILIYAACLLFGLFGVKAYVNSQTSNPVISQMACQYLRICCIVSFGMAAYNITEKLLQATGRSRLSTTAQLTGALINIILDPILIYGLFGLPKMGVTGAAWATVIGQIASGSLGMIFHFCFNVEIKKHIRLLKPSGKIIKGIYAIGFPAIISQALISFMTYGLNLILVRISESAVTAYGLYYKIQQFVLMAAFGLRDTITPILSFNHGMGNKKRVQEGVRYGVLYTLAVMFIGMILIEVLAKPFISVFGLSGTTADMCISAMHVVTLSFLFAAVNIALQGVFQALNAGLSSLIVSVCRQFVFVIPIAWGFSLIARNDFSMIWLVWLTFLIAEGLTMVISILLMRHVNKTTIAPMRG